MLNSSKRASNETFEFSNSRRLCHDGRTTASLGCQQCHLRALCGGLQVEGDAFNCLSFCHCKDMTKCDNVCPRNVPYQVARMREVHGLELDGVANAPIIAVPELPQMVPMVYHNSARARAPAANVVALSLYDLISRDGHLKFTTRDTLLQFFKLRADTTVILSGTDHDPSIERWWKLTDRVDIARGLVRLGVALVTAPNFSLFHDVPRHDNLFNMKRIAVVWSEIQNAGVPCALHVNARTDRDYERWTDFLVAHGEITHIAFEFGTGAGVPTRIEWHIEHLNELARAVGRPLHLIVRGGTRELQSLRDTFPGLTLIDTNVFMKSQKRKRACIVGTKLKWQSAPTAKGVPIDELLDDNIATLEQFFRTTMIIRS